MPTSDRKRKIIERVEELDVPEEDDNAVGDPGWSEEDEDEGEEEAGDP